MKEIYSKSSVVGWPANEAPVFTRDFQDQSGWLHADGREGRARGSLEPSGSLGGFRVPGSACVPCLCCLPTTGVLAYGSLICTSGPVLCPGGRGNRELRKYFSVLGEWLAIYLCCLPGPRAELSKWLGCNVLQACLRLCSGDHSPRLPSHLRRGSSVPTRGVSFGVSPLETDCQLPGPAPGPGCIRLFTHLVSTAFLTLEMVSLLLNTAVS